MQVLKSSHNISMYSFGRFFSSTFKMTSPPGALKGHNDFIAEHISSESMGSNSVWGPLRAKLLVKRWTLASCGWIVFSVTVCAYSKMVAKASAFSLSVIIFRLSWQTIFGVVPLLPRRDLDTFHNFFGFSSIRSTNSDHLLFIGQFNLVYPI